MQISKGCLQGQPTRVQIVSDVWVNGGMEYKRPGSLLFPNRRTRRTTFATAATSVDSNRSFSNPLKYLRHVKAIHDWWMTNRFGSHMKSYTITKDHKKRRRKNKPVVCYKEAQEILKHTVSHIRGSNTDTVQNNTKKYIKVMVTP